MKRFTHLAAALSGVLISLASVAYASAQPVAQQRLALTGVRSDSNLRWASRRMEENIDMLQHDRHDYGGFRLRAIALFQQAREQLALGFAFDRAREGARTLARTNRPDASMVYLRGQCASDVNLNLVRRNIERIMDVLQKDAGDYGGHRVAALKLLAQGRESLRDAINWDATH